MRSPYIAHIGSDEREQALTDHLKEVSCLAGTFAASFGMEEQGRLCGLAHDLGKYSEAFQRRIRGANIPVDHSTAGCKELFGMGQLYAAFCVAGHHGGLPDLGDRYDAPDMPTLRGRIKRDVEDYAAWRNELSLPESGVPESTDIIGQAMMTRMLYSCLVDADFLDTERFMSDGKAPRPAGEPLSALLEKLNRHIDKKGFLRPQGKINELRADVLSACIEGGEQQPGLFSLTVPTGGGKTIASLAFALGHAVRHGMERVIYVIPYCSIIDQTSAVFRSIFGGGNVLEHHSGTVFNTGQDGCLTPENSRLALASENWDMPIVVTTSVQFFESLYANRPSSCRKLHNIANSVVVFDEAQMLPVPCLEPCVSAIGLLVGQFRASAVLCTATQPVLDGFFAKTFPGIERKEIYPETERLFKELSRVSFEHAGRLTDDELAARIQSHRQALCVVNSRRQAQELFGKLSGEGNIHLSTLMTPSDRTELIKLIRKRLKNGEICRVISTSLIEAGVDVDFPAVYRAEAGLDSILQAAGRCNREGRRPAKQSIVTVFKTDTPPPLMIRTNIGAMREIAPLYPEMDSPQAVRAYFKSLLSLKDNFDMHGVLDAFARGEFPFRKIAKRFHLLDSPTKTVYIPIGEGADLVARMRGGEGGREFFRKLGRHGVTVYKNHFAELLSAGDIEPVDDGTAVLINLDLYDEQIGLSLSAQWGKAYFG